MEKINIGGVPEHFNYPWHYGIKHGIFAKHGLEISWQDVKGGSGAMCSLLDSGELDVALVLTEGIIKHIHSGSSSRIIQQYVKSPLVWGVHSATKASFNADDLSTARFARSRVGSGSHLMAYVHAEQKGYDLNEENFRTVGNIDGALTAFDENKADILLWEKFMTQPYVTSQKVNRIGLCVSPWPCFMMVGSGPFVNDNSGVIEKLSLAIIEASDEVTKNENTVSEISEMYGLKEDQVAQWYSSVEWQTSPWISKKMISNVIATLNRISIINEPKSSSEMCTPDALLY
ncbi:MAG: hypothetical protein ACPGTP_00120 [Bacteroidia bacterium]